MNMRYDVAIVGTGPAGLSAAITLKIRNKNIILIGPKDLSKKIRKASEIRNYPGLPMISGDDLAKRFQAHLEQMNIEITEEKITSIYAMGSYYALQTSENHMYEAETVILATGVVFGKPYFGEERLLGRGVSYCATCDAPLYKGKTIAAIGYSPKAEEEVQFLSELAGKVYYFPIYRGEMTFAENVAVVKDIPIAIEGENKAEKIIAKKCELDVDGVFILRESISPGQMVPGLEVDEKHVKVNRKMETNLKGCFACGDIVGEPYQYIKAAGEGNVAALSVAGFLDKAVKEKGEEK